MKKRTRLFVVLLLLLPWVVMAENNDIKLIIRADDIGSAHAANIACIKSFNEGIVRSTEIMVPCAWFEEAVLMLNDTPGLDVGVHLTITSEWSYIKWRPVACTPSLTGKEGYFFPFLWTNKNYPPGNALLEADWKVADVEKEFRAQIELVKSKIPAVSHLSDHMGCANITPEVAAMTKRLAIEYNLDIDLEEYGVQYAGEYGTKKTETTGDKINNFIDMLNNLQPGIWLFVEHPALDVQEMDGYGHIGYDNVGKDRQAVTDIFTSPLVKEAVAKRGIKLVSYADMKNEIKVKPAK
ncbi:MAG TPA: polysaccharide deacetylase family protein [bacterium]|nr:polysaccharide deacetylase family protein [bacterium]HPN42118.1 polysaccharide deacetylase family protein [bacterium]